MIYLGLLKETVQRDFFTPVFFIKRLVLVSIDMPKSDFEIYRIFVELFVPNYQRIGLPTVNDIGSQKLSRRQPIFFTFLQSSW
jgi:hypothetical protein